MASSPKKIPPRGLLLIIIFLIFISIFTAFLKINFKSAHDSITGNIVSTGAEGGNVTYANASKINASAHWQGYFGEISVDASASLPAAVAHGGNVTQLNLVLPCLGNEIYASAKSDVTLQGINSGKKESIDAFLNLDSSNLESGSNIFTAMRDFTVSSALISSVPTTFMKVSGSGSSPFALGILNQSNVLVFLSNVSLDTIGFDGQTHDYEMMLPVNQSELTYHFFSDCEVVPPGPAPAPAAPSTAAKAGKSFFPAEKGPLVIEIVKKEGKLLATGYPIAVTVFKGEKSQQPLQIHNIGEGDLTNVRVMIAGLPLGVFSISPEKYDRMLPGEKRDFTLEFQGNLEAGTYDIQVMVVSDQGTSIIEGVLIVKEILPKQKLPLAGAAAGLPGNYNTLLLYLMLLLLLLLLAFALWHLLLKHRHETYHPCTIEELLHNHEEGDRIKVTGKITALGKDKKQIFSRLTDRTGSIDALTDTYMKGMVEIRGIVQRDADRHKFIKT